MILILSIYLLKNGIIIRTLKEGENFGERSIFVNAKRSLDVIGPVNLLAIDEYERVFDFR